MDRLSSGTRLVESGSDAAGAAVATNLQVRIGSTRQAIRNTNDGISMLQTADASAKEVVNLIDRMRQLTIQAASETLDASQRKYLADEVKTMTLEANRIAKNTDFNGIELGAGATIAVQVGVDGNTMTNAVRFRTLNLQAVATGLKSIDLTSSTTSRSSIEVIDAQMSAVHAGRASMGAVHNQLESSLTNAAKSLEALTASASRVADTDYAHETSAVAAHQVRLSAGAAALGQANQMATSVMSLI